MTEASKHSDFTRVRVDAAGRIVIPADVRESLGIKQGAELILSNEPDGIH
jgi:AbrB family looped-hinge helix DNA binding protein